MADYKVFRFLFDDSFFKNGKDPNEKIANPIFEYLPIMVIGESWIFRNLYSYAEFPKYFFLRGE